MDGEVEKFEGVKETDQGRSLLKVKKRKDRFAVSPAPARAWRNRCKSQTKPKPL